MPTLAPLIIVGLLLGQIFLRKEQPPVRVARSLGVAACLAGVWGILGIWIVPYDGIADASMVAGMALAMFGFGILLLRLNRLALWRGWPLLFLLCGGPPLGAGIATGILGIALIVYLRKRSAVFGISARKHLVTLLEELQALGIAFVSLNEGN